MIYRIYLCLDTCTVMQHAHIQSINNKSAMTYPDERVHIQGAFGITSKLCC